MSQPLNLPEHTWIGSGLEGSEDRSTPRMIAHPAPMCVAGAAHRPGHMESLLEIPFIHQRLIISCTLLGILAGWMALLAWPRSYESEAKLMIRAGHESVSLDPTATTGSTLMLQKTQEEDVISALEVLSSRRVAETTVDQLGVDALLSGVSPDALAEGAPQGDGLVAVVKGGVAQLLHSVLQCAGLKDAISNRELAVRELQSSLEIYSPKKSNVIVVGSRSKTPKMAQAIVKQVTDSFLEEHLKGAQTIGSHDFFQQQSADVQKRLEELEVKRSDFMQEHEIISIEANRDLLQGRLAGIDRDLVTAYGELEQALSQIADLQSKIDDINDPMVSESDSTWSTLRQRINALELEEQRRAAIYSGNHPALVQVRMQLDAAQEILAKLKRERADESITPNPTKFRLREELQTQQTQVAGLRSLIERKEKQRAEIEQQTQTLLHNEQWLTQIDRNIQITENSLQMLREKLEEARVIDELQSATISSVHVFQPATFVERAASPKKKIVAAGFLLGGLTMGLGLALLRHGSLSSLRTSEDVEYALGVPAVASIPRLPRTEPLRLREIASYRETCQALIGEMLLNPARRRRASGRSIGIIGVDTGAGASTLAANLAIASSVDCRMKTILVDADTRQQSVSKIFGLNGTPGLVELINGSASHDECLQRAKNAPVDVIASAADTCHELLTASASEIVGALQAFEHDCDLLLVDLPAASQPDQAIALVQQLDGVLVVIESEKTQTVAAERLLRRLLDSHTEVIGVVVNKTRCYLPKLIRRFVSPRV